MKDTLLFIIIFAMLLCSCSTDKEEQHPPEANLDPEPAYRKISVDEAYNIMLTSENYVLLDVRTAEEYEEQRIEGALLLPDYKIADSAESELPDKSALILVYCRSGRRSAGAAKELSDMGYTNIYDFGGIIDWPYETISQKTQK